MRFAAVFREFTRRAPFAVASPAARGTWTSVYAYAAEIEQQGRIAACAAYDDRQWLALAQVTVSDLAEAVAAGLLRWEGQDLIVVAYDVEGEAKYREAAERAKRNGAKGGRPKKTDSEPSGKPRAKPTGNRVGLQDETDSEPGREPGRNQDRKPSSSASSDPSTGGGGSAAAGLAAFRSERDKAARSNPGITVAEPPRDLNEFEVVVGRLAADQVQFVGEAARRYFQRSGRSQGDQKWRTERWSLHYFSTQGLEALLPDIVRRASKPQIAPPRAPDPPPKPWTEAEKAEAGELRRSLAKGAA